MTKLLDIPDLDFIQIVVEAENAPIKDFYRTLISGGMRVGLERAAVYFENQLVDREPLAAAMRTLASGGDPCEDCGHALPIHDSSCISRHR